MRVPQRPLLSKTVLIMKLTMALLLVACMQATAGGFAQKVSFSAKDVSIEKVFTAIKQQTGYLFVIDEKLAEKLQTVSINVQNASVDEVVKACLANQPKLSYRMVGKTIVLQEVPDWAPQLAYSPPPAADVYGLVVDAKTGDPLTGATVTWKGSKRSVSTDVQGRFKITVEMGTGKAIILVVSFIGFETFEHIVKAGGQQRIELKVSTQSINDMVVTGIYTRSKANFTGAASSFTAAELARVSNNNVLSALAALDPSFRLPENINRGSNPNALAEVVIRGGNSVVDPAQAGAANPFNYNNNPNTPLFIIDGFEASLQRVNDLDMNRIAKVDILKDAAATAIYGSRAANGVVIFETIRPQNGKLRFTYNGNFRLEAPDLTGYNLLNAEEKLKLEQQTGVYQNSFNYIQVQLDEIYNQRLAAVRSGVNTDWIAQPVRSGVGYKHNIYLEGGGNNALYGINLTYDNVAGAMKGSNRKTTTANTYLSYRVKNLLFRNDLTLGFNKAINSPYGNFTQYASLNPYWTPYDASGNTKVYLEDIRDNEGRRLTNFDRYSYGANGLLNPRLTGTDRIVNPLYNAGLNTVDQTTYQYLINNFFVQWQARTWLRFTGRLAYTRQNDESDVFLPAQHTSFVTKPTFEKGTYTKGYGKLSTLEGQVTADVTKNFGKNLVIATVGTNLQESKYTIESFQVQGFPNPRLDQLTLGNRFPDGSKPTGAESVSRLAGFLSNVSYAYDNKYLLDVSGRLDGSSKFGRSKTFAPFWSVGAGWNLHNENFIRQYSFVNRLKLRYSFGYTGSQNFPSYQGISTSRYYTGEEYRGVIGTYLLGYGNNQLAWQKTNKQNLGADITLFRRLDVTANYYIEKTAGSIIQVSTPASVGFSSYGENMGDVKSEGWELNLKYNVIDNPQKRNFLSVFLNATHITNKIERVSNTIAQLNKLANDSLSTRPITRYAEGQSTTAIWAVPSLGIDPSTGLEIYKTRDGILTNTYNPRDQDIVGDLRPAVEGTFGTNLEINGIGANVFFRFRTGGQAYNQTLVERVENVQFAYFNVDRRVSEERWTKPGDKTFFKGLTNAGGLSTNPTFATSRFVMDDRLLSCESLSVYYRFGNAFNKRLGLQNTRVTLYTAELFRLSSIKRERGLEYPFSRSFTLQLQTTF